jgi:preprotein translocase subunit SecA
MKVFEYSQKGRPVLVGTISIEKSEKTFSAFKIQRDYS